jgi:protein-tyrosine phosphatase
LARLVAEQSPVLVQCHAGRSRSAVVVAGHLVRSHGVGAEEAVALVAARRAVNITPALLSLLEALE